MTQSRIRSVGRLCVLTTIVALSIAGSCPPERGPLAASAIERQECPMDDTTLGILLLPGPTTRIPEFHDCQRFIVHDKSPWGSWREYGPLEAIWVRGGLDTVSFPLPTGGSIPGRADSSRTDPDNPAVTLFWVNDTLGMTEGPATEAVGVAVALVWSSEGGFADLGIEAGYNCLYLYSTSPGTWEAKMVPVKDQADCFANVVPSTVTGTVLAVRERKFPGRGSDDFPPVVRWQQGPRSYNVGVRCLAAWCEIGPDEGLTAAAYGLGRTREIKGWYDEQHLAVHTAGGKQWPTSILGTAFPDEGLDALTRNGFTPNTWLPVAHTVLRHDPGFDAPQADEFQTYEQKFNFDAGSVPELMNTISFCFGTQAGCFPDSQVNPPTCNKAGEGLYWARITSATGRTVHRCVTYTNHGMTLPGVVRWRWLANDEKNWVSCPSGCCQVNQ